MKKSAIYSVITVRAYMESTLFFVFCGLFFKYRAVENITPRITAIYSICHTENKVISYLPSGAKNFSKNSLKALHLKTKRNYMLALYHRFVRFSTEIKKI